jgi:hypothetical protein
MLFRPSIQQLFNFPNDWEWDCRIEPLAADHYTFFKSLSEIGPWKRGQEVGGIESESDFTYVIKGEPLKNVLEV